MKSLRIFFSTLTGRNHFELTSNQFEQLCLNNHIKKCGLEKEDLRVLFSKFFSKVKRNNKTVTYLEFYYLMKTLHHKCAPIIESGRDVFEFIEYIRQDKESDQD